MQYTPKFSIQVSGDIRRWSNPDRTFHHGMMKIDFACEADLYPGILVLTDSSYKSATAFAVQNLRKELPLILEPLNEDAIAYWSIIQNDIERDKLLSSLTRNPVFNDHLG
jgi:hypothetical protein